MGASCATPLQDERFLLLEALGRGGTGTVYRAFDRAEQRLVALKVPSASGGAGPAHPLAEEFGRWAHLRHPNIVRAYEMGHSESGPIPEGTPYLVLEHVRASPVHRALPADRGNEAVAEQFALQVLSALAHVHAAGYVHRDVKPGNVLSGLTAQRRPRFKLTDFGLASRVGELRAAGTISGSLPYVAPEALLGLPLDGRCDLYGLGILLYRLVTGRMPLPGAGAPDLLRWHLSGPAADPARVRPGLSPRLGRFIRRLMLRDRTERPASAVRALELLGARPPLSLPRARPPLAARGSLAALRLALDAARLGARRVFRLPESPEIADLLRHELSVWSQVRGVKFYRVEGRAARLVPRLLAERGGDAADLARRFGLHRRLPLETLGGLPLLDPARESPDRRAVRTAARAIADLVLHLADHRPLVLCFERMPDSPLGRGLRDRLVGAAERRLDAPRERRGGLLVVV